MEEDACCVLMLASRANVAATDGVFWRITSQQSVTQISRFVGWYLTKVGIFRLSLVNMQSTLAEEGVSEDKQRLNKLAAAEQRAFRRRNFIYRDNFEF